jgi:hypothetical protein
MEPQAIRCPTAYCAPSQHAHELSESDKYALRIHAQIRDAKSLRAEEAARKRGTKMSEYSPRNKRRML